MLTANLMDVKVARICSQDPSSDSEPTSLLPFLLGQGEENDAEMEEAPVDDPPEEKDGLPFFFIAARPFYNRDR